MTFKDYQDWVKDHAPPGARSYRLHAEVSGQLFVFPAPPLPGLALSPPAMPLVASGQYLVAYEDQSGKVEMAPAPVNWVFPAKVQTAVSGKAIEADVEDVVTSLELEQTAAEASTVRARSHSLNETLGLYRSFTQAMGTQSAHELRVKNEQMDLVAQACTKLLETQVELMDTFRQHAANLRTPPPPPQWDKIVAAAAPAFAAMYVETVQAIRGDRRKTKGPTADLLTPVDEKLSKMYELLGNVSSDDRLELLLKDPSKLRMWMKSVQNFMSGEPKAEDTAE